MCTSAQHFNDELLECEVNINVVIVLRNDVRVVSKFRLLQTSLQNKMQLTRRVCMLSSI